MDAEIGSLRAHLDELGIADNALVVYTTDNGGSTCNYGVNQPLRGTKYTLWEDGIRVPFIVRWPGRVPAHEIRSGFGSSMDILPTALAAAGVPVVADRVDGVDKFPLLVQSDAGYDALHWDCGCQWAIRSGDWKLWSGCIVSMNGGESRLPPTVFHFDQHARS